MDGSHPRQSRPAERGEKTDAGRDLPNLTRVRSRYTRFVRTMKLALPLAAGGLIALLVIWPQLREKPKGFRLKTTPGKVEDVGGQRVLNPRYRGSDKRNQSFVVTADEARQFHNSPDDVALKNPRASMTLRSGAWVVLNAPQGKYAKSAGLLSLHGGIKLFHDEGYDLHTEGATINLRNGTAESVQPVKGKGPLGDITADGFQVLDEGHRLLFTGRSKLILNKPDEPPGSKSP